MERIEVTDELLYKYMPIVDAMIIQELESQVDIEYEFSQKFEKKMKRLIKREAHPWIGVVQNIIRRVAVFFIGVISAILIFTMSVEAYREKFFGVIKTFLEDSVLYSYFSDEKGMTLMSCEPTYVPEGYHELERIESDISLIIIYENDLGEQIVWEQKLVVDGGSLVLDSEYDTQEIREIDDTIATVYLYSDGYAMAYYEHNQYVYYITADRLKSEELFNMINSMIDYSVKGIGG